MNEEGDGGQQGDREAPTTAEQALVQTHASPKQAQQRQDIAARETDAEQLHNDGNSDANGEAASEATAGDVDRDGDENTQKDDGGEWTVVGTKQRDRQFETERRAHQTEPASLVPAPASPRAVPTDVSTDRDRTALQDQVARLSAQVQEQQRQIQQQMQEQQQQIQQQQALADALERSEERVEDLQSEYETLNALFQPVQAENEQRKTMLTEQRKLALSLSQRRKDLNLPTKRMGELDSAKLHALGVPAEEISELQQLVTDVSWHPWRMVQRKTHRGEGQGEAGVEMLQVPNWEEPKLREIVDKYESSGSSGGSGSKGEQVAEEVLRCSKELQEWNPSGSYCVTIPYHFGEQRELRPAELLKIVAGIEVPSCRPVSDSCAGQGQPQPRAQSSGAGAGAGTGTRAVPPGAPSWSVVTGRRRGGGS